MAGHYPVKMTDLNSLYKGIGFTDAQTYIQSGNVIFRCSENLHHGDIVKRIEGAMLDRFGYYVPVMIRTTEEIRRLLSVNPYLNEENFNAAKTAVIFLHEPVSDAQIKKVIDIDYPPDKFKIEGSEIFIFCPNGFGRTKLYTNFFEKKMGVTGTARNWKTITKILALAEKN
jgi:uncharacterized protein (DUF1697 family)